MASRNLARDRNPYYKPYPEFRRRWANRHLWNRTESKKISYMEKEMLIFDGLDGILDRTLKT
jgi:hypothetical protein